MRRLIEPPAAGPTPAEITMPETEIESDYWDDLVDGWNAERERYPSMTFQEWTELYA